MWSRSLHLTGRFVPDVEANPGGITAISRWLSAATPPDSEPNEPTDPGRVAAQLRSRSIVSTDTIQQERFAWQSGYSIFSVSATARDPVGRYIKNQREHHRVKSYREELVEMLRRAGVEYDPKYLD